MLELMRFSDENKLFHASMQKRIAELSPAESAEFATFASKKTVVSVLNVPSRIVEWFH